MSKQLKWLFGDSSPEPNWQNFVKFFKRDWLSDTVKLSVRERGLGSFFADLGLLFSNSMLRGREVEVVRRERHTLLAARGSPWAASTLVELIQQALDGAGA